MVALTIPDLERRTRYSPGSPTTGPFSVGFAIFALDEIAVYDDGALVDPGDYTVAGSLGANGAYESATVTFDSNVSGTIDIVGHRPPARESAFSEGAGVPTLTLNQTANRTVIEAREAYDRLQRALLGPFGVTMQMLPAMTAGKALVVNDDEDGFEMGPDADEITSAQSYATAASASAAAAAVSAAAAQAALVGALRGASSVANLLTFDGDDTPQAFLGAAGREAPYRWESSDLSASLLGDAIASSAVNDSTETITSTAHGLYSGTPVVVTAAVDGLSAQTIYYAIKVDADNFKLATTRANALAGTAINLTGTDPVTIKRHFDPDQLRVIPPTGGAIDGSEGGWVLAGAFSTGGYFQDDGTPGRVGRWHGALGLGDAAGIDLNRLHGNGNTGTWIDRDLNQNYTYIATAPQLAVGHVQGGVAVLGYTRSSDNPGTGGDAYGATIGVLAFAVADKASNFAWAGYDELVRYDGAGGVNVREIEISNLGTDAGVPSPVGIVGAGEWVSALGLGIGGGGLITDGGPVSGTLQNISDFIHFTKAGAVFSHDARAYVGLTFLYNCLVRSNPADETSDATWVHTHRGQGWLATASSGQRIMRIRPNHADDTKYQILEFGDPHFRLLVENADGDEYSAFQVQIPTPGSGVGVNTIGIVPQLAGAGGGIVAAVGTDTNINVNVRGKGSLGVQLQDGAGTTKFAVSVGGIGVFGTTPVAAKGGWGAWTGTALRTTAATYTAPTVTNPPTQAEVQDIADHLEIVSQHMKGLIDDFHQTAGYGWLRS